MIRICPAKTMPRWASVGGTDRRERYLTAKERPAASLRFGVEISSHLTPCKKCGGVNEVLPRCMCPSTWAGLMGDRTTGRRTPKFGKIVVEAVVDV